MINLVKKDNLNLSILETDFEVFADITNTFSSDVLKKDCLIDLDDYIIPEYFRNKITLVIQTNKMLIGYASFEFKNKNNITQVDISKLYVLEEFRNKGMEELLIEGVAYVSGEVGARNVVTSIDEHDEYLYKTYRSLGFYEVGMNEDGNLLSVSVISMVSSRKLNDKFRDIAPDSINYKDLRLVKRIASGRSGNIYLTEDGRILKMFTSNSFTYIKDREETLKVIKEIDVPEVVKPKHLVYYDGIFVGYIMEYLPDGEPLSTLGEKCSFEDKIDKIKAIESVMKKLHDNKIYICDLNPDNIFFDKSGNIKLIDCDSFVVKENVINNDIEEKYRDPFNRIVSSDTDIYAFAITCLQLLTDTKIKSNSTFQDVEKIYNKNKIKLPISFKNYFEFIFKGKDRVYLSDSYQKYLEEMYNGDASEGIVSEKSGKISIIILSFILLAIAIIGLIIFKFSR